MPGLELQPCGSLVGGKISQVVSDCMFCMCSASAFLVAGSPLPVALAVCESGKLQQLGGHPEKKHALCKLQCKRRKGVGVCFAAAAGGHFVPPSHRTRYFVSLARQVVFLPP